MDASPLQLLHGAEVFAPEPLGRANLLVGGERLLWIGTGHPALPVELEVVEHDLSGLCLCPGLIDPHVHLTGGGGEAGFASRVPPPLLSAFTRGGTTTVVGLLGTDDTARATPELVAASRSINEQGLSAFAYTGGYHLPPMTLTGTVRGDIAFVDCIIGVGELALSDHRSSQPTLDELLRVAADAHVAGLLAGKAGVVHLHMGDGERGLDLVSRALDATELPPRVFYPTHVNRRAALLDEAVSLARRGSTIDVTVFPDSRSGAVPAADAIERYLRDGEPEARLTASTDAGGSIPVFDDSYRTIGMQVGAPDALGDALAELVERGVPLERALLPFTLNPATILRLARKGRIAVGADADLVTLGPGSRVLDVMARGRWHVRGGEPVVVGTFEADRRGAD